MKIILCDDEEYLLEGIVEYCKRFEKENMVPIHIIRFTDGIECLNFYRKNKDVDLCILDIKMKKVNGIQIAEEIRKEGARTKIIFLTSSIKYAPQGYVVGAKRYWMKPLTFEKFSADLIDIIDEIKNEKELFILEDTGSAIEKVYFDDILYIETEGRKTCVHKKDVAYISKITMSEYESKLDGRFYRCHAGYIVNMYYICKIEGMNIYLKNEEQIFISKAKRSKFMQRFAEFLKNE